MLWRSLFDEIGYKIVVYKWSCIKLLIDYHGLHALSIKPKY